MKNIKNKFIMMIGLPASGKSTYTNKLKEDGFIVHSSDELRKELYDTVNEFSNNGELFQELHKRIKNDLTDGKDVCLDATNLSYKKRLHFLKNVINKIDCHKKAVIMATPYNDCVDRDRKREKKVGSHVIERFYKQFTMPNYFEGWDEIEIVYSDDKYEEFDIDKERDLLRTIHQNNKNHTQTIGDHCICVGEQLLHKIPSDRNLIQAGYLHDIGKKFTKSFKNSNNKVCDEAHYYSHENVGSYDTMFYLEEFKKYDYYTTDIIDICNLIQYHMKPHTYNGGEKSKNKFKNLVGEEFWNRILLLHEADKNGR